MLMRLLLTATVSLSAAACSAALPWNPPTRASTAIDGTYSGVGVMAKQASQPFCSGTTSWPFATPKLTVQNASVIWPASGTVTATLPVAADGTFYGQFGTNTLSGRITGNHMDAYSDGLSCGTIMSLNKS
jgi:hypothetical protein